MIDWIMSSGFGLGYGLWKLAGEKRMGIDWRHIGPISWERWENELRAVGSPIADNQIAWGSANEHSALALAQLFVESQGGTDGRLVQFNNPLGLRPGPAGWNNGSVGTVTLDGAGQFLKFATIGGCIAQWYERITDPSYKNGVYAKTKTLEDYIHVYAPNGDGANNEAAYVERVKQLLTRWGKNLDEGETPVPTGIPVVQQIIPVSAAHRPGTKLTSNWNPYSITVHETGNPAVGATAKMHADYLTNGAEGRTVGWHLTVDKDGVYQHLPLDEMGYHASDGADNSNVDQGAFGTIAIETCINYGTGPDAEANKAKTRKNLAEVIARIEAGDPAFNWGGGGTKGKFGNGVYEHYKFAADKKNCPALMRNEGFVPANGTIDQGPLFDLIQTERAKWDAAPGVVTVVPGMTLEALQSIWDTVKIDPTGPVFKLYVEEAKKSGYWPTPNASRWAERRDGGIYWEFMNPRFTIWRPDAEPNVRVLK